MMQKGREAGQSSAGTVFTSNFFHHFHTNDIEKKSQRNWYVNIECYHIGRSCCILWYTFTILTFLYNIEFYLQHVLKFNYNIHVYMGGKVVRSEGMG
jgi:hypothetical protein